jgi:hypothetical protein
MALHATTLASAGSGLALTALIQSILKRLEL